MQNSRFILAFSSFLGLVAFLLQPVAGLAQDRPASPPPKVVIEDDGTVEMPAMKVPISEFLSPEAKAYVTQHLKQVQDPAMLKPNNGVPPLLKSFMDRDYALFAVDKKDQKIAGVHVYDYTPKSGVSAGNKDRVLINLHGGGFMGCWPACAELESIPVSALGKIRVVSIDYRQGPDNKFPAASEDVASVYRELLKTHKPENVGIYGCSAGGMQTAMSVAWFQTHELPRPGAIGILCAGAGTAFGGDSAYTTIPIGEGRAPMPMSLSTSPLGYFSGADPKDPLISPINSPEVARKFPPTLVITGTRSMELSAAVHTHAQLIKFGVDADLHVWEGLFHGFFYNVDVPESKDVFDVIIKFFDRHLGNPADLGQSSNRKK